MKCVVSRNLTSDPPQCLQEWQVTFLVPMVVWNDVSRVAGSLSPLISRLAAPTSYGNLLEKRFDKGGGVPTDAPCTLSALGSHLHLVDYREREWKRKNLHEEHTKRELQRKSFPYFSMVMPLPTMWYSVCLSVCPCAVEICTVEDQR